jgi:hypothetical protein
MMRTFELRKDDAPEAPHRHDARAANRSTRMRTHAKLPPRRHGWGLGRSSTLTRAGRRCGRCAAVPVRQRAARSDRAPIGRSPRPTDGQSSDPASAGPGKATGRLRPLVANDAPVNRRQRSHRDEVGRGSCVRGLRAPGSSGSVKRERRRAPPPPHLRRPLHPPPQGARPPDTKRPTVTRFTRVTIGRMGRSTRVRDRSEGLVGQRIRSARPLRSIVAGP